jgi:REP element-mobilizing transposase RayT
MQLPQFSIAPRSARPGIASPRDRTTRAALAKPVRSTIVLHPPELGIVRKNASLISMPNYRRPHIAGGTYFITQVTYQRERWFCGELGRRALREALITVRQSHPFTINAFVLLPDHFHGLWTLPPDDGNLSVRVRLIKTYVTKHYGKALGIDRQVSVSRQKRGESNLWQRRFWEHLIRAGQS